uniref:Uncharacterized protein n=1 Tax=Hericium coralloides TaxID=100756 RepID=A0A1P8NNI1_HERCO|nr:hypothetical protein [Hericium coralloides]APX41094.1 hypothetical protein [Hericium coralloides]
MISIEDYNIDEYVNTIPIEELFKEWIYEITLPVVSYKIDTNSVNYKYLSKTDIIKNNIISEKLKNNIINWKDNIGIEIKKIEIKEIGVDTNDINLTNLNNIDKNSC